MADPYADIAQPADDPYAAIAQARPDFSKNPPGVPRPTIDMREHYIIGGEEKQPIGQQIGDIGASMAKGAYQVSAPGIAASVAGTQLPAPFEPAPLKQLPHQIMGTALPIMAGAEELPESDVSPNVASPEVPSTSNVASRILDVAKRRAGKIPGVQAVKDINYVVRGPAPKPPEPTTPKVEPPAETAPNAEPAVDTSKKAVGSLLEEGTGAKPLQPDVPIGHTAVKSSAVSSYRYDPGKQEMHVVYKGDPNKVHVFGDVSPEQAQYVESAESKGKAMHAIKSGSPLLRKRDLTTGKEIVMRPTQ